MELNSLSNISLNMEFPLIDLITRLKQPGLIAIGFATFFAFVSLAKHTILLIWHRTRGISVISAPNIFSDNFYESESDSDSDDSSSSSEKDEEEETEDIQCFGDVFRNYEGQDGNFDEWLSGAVVKTWEGLGFFGLSSDQSDLINDDEDGDYIGTDEVPVVRYWDDGLVPERPRWRRKRSFVMIDTW